MTEAALSDLYRDYIGCLNRQHWPDLQKFVRDDVRHNGRPLGLAGYRAMLERDFDAIPDLRFNVEMLVSEPPLVASRLSFDCTPKGLFLGLPVNGKRVSFAENVFYKFRSGEDRAGLVGHRQGGDRISALRRDGAARRSSALHRRPNSRSMSASLSST